MIYDLFIPLIRLFSLSVSVPLCCCFISGNCLAALFWPLDSFEIYAN